MKNFKLSSHAVPTHEYLRTAPREEDTKEVFSEPGVYEFGGRPAIIYGKLAGDYNKMLWAIRNLPFTQDSRTTPGGAIGERGRKKLGESRIFGFRPRIPYGANYCSITSLQHTHPKQNEILCEFGQLLAAIYRNFATEAFEEHCRSVAGVRAEWLLPGTPFTSGIVNRNNPLNYHFDKGNFPGNYSSMVVFRRNCEGGYLSVPQFNARFLLEDNSFLLFDGQSILHGVTPIKKLNRNSYRYSVVYYTLKAMGKCGSLDEELNRARSEKRAREQRRATGPEPVPTK